MLRTFFARLSSCTSAFKRDREGSILPIAGLSFVVLMVIAGAGVDIGRAVTLKSEVSNALDAALLNVARQLSTSTFDESTIQEKLSDAFEANMESLHLADSEIGDVSFTNDTDEGVLSASVTATMKTYFIRLGGIGPKTFDVAVSGNATYSRYDVELALVLDVTNSMGSELSSLKTAAKALVNTLVPSSGSLSDEIKVRISIIPYSEGVNLGSYASTVTNNRSSSGNCVTERTGDQQFTDEPYNYGGEDSSYFYGAAELMNYDGYLMNRGDYCPEVSLLPLTDSNSDLIAKIEELELNGGTAGQTGISWGWYTLSPNWSSLWPTDSAPSAYGTSHLLKFAVIMTDGDFNDYFDLGSYTKCTTYSYDSRGRRYCSEYTTYTDQWIEYYTASSSYSGTSAVRGRTYCDAMKDDGIRLFGVYFETTGSSFGAKQMEYCASSSQNYYEATNEDELVSAFEQIAQRIQQIYLSK